jgi:asparagine synthase (glutamine-hydrolysing)
MALADPRAVGNLPERTIGGTWLVRWQSLREPAPRVLQVPNGGPAEGGAAALESGGFVVFAGHLFDRTESGGEASASDAALAAVAYQRWGRGLLEKVRGAFTLAVWDEERRRLTLGRDTMGLHPCHYWWDGQLFLASPAIDALLGQPEISRRFNRVVIAEYVQNSFPHHQAGETFYEGIRRLPPAHFLELYSGTLVVARYWDPVPPGFAWADRAELSCFMPTFERAVERCLTAGADCIALSGGFDSVSIAAVAARSAVRDRPLYALSGRFVGTPYDEGETQIAVARGLGMPQVLRALGDDASTGNFIENALALSGMIPSPALSPWLALYRALMADASRLGLRRMMMGTGGDEMFGVDLSYGTDRLAVLDLPAVWRFFRAIQRASVHPTGRVAKAVLWRGAVLPLLRQLGRATLERSSPGTLEWVLRRRHRVRLPWLVPADSTLRAALEERIGADPPMVLAPGEGAYVRSIRRLLQNPLVMVEQDQNHAWARAFGFNVLFPYYDRDLVELSLRMEPDYLLAGGRLKAPLRQLVAERLPDVSIGARKVDYTQGFHKVFRPGGQRAWRRLRGPMILAELGIVEPCRLNRLMETYFAGSSVDPLIPWMVLSTEAWLQERSGPVNSLGRGGSS